MRPQFLLRNLFFIGFLVLATAGFSKAYLVISEMPVYFYPDDFTQKIAKAQHISKAAGSFFWKNVDSKAEYFRVDNEDHDLSITVSSDRDLSKKYSFLNAHLTEDDWYYLNIDFSKFPECRQKLLFESGSIEFLVYDAASVNALGSVAALEQKSDPKYFWIKVPTIWKNLVNLESFCTGK
jgi:hypothetical protein